jgi:CHAD domain-containing protein
MSSVITIPGSPVPKRGLRESMERVLRELDTVRKDPAPDPVHDLRVAIRRCRSVGAVFQEFDPDPAWSELRRVPRKLFRRLGALRDAQVMDDWVKHLAPEGDPLRARLHSSFTDNEPDLRDHALRSVEKFDIKSWTRLEQKLRRRVRLVPPSSLAAQCLAVERIDEARDLHARAQRTDNPAAWHELRIGIKRFRYTVENLLPNHYVLWSKNLKRLQDILGDVHDLDVLAVLIKEVVAKNVPDDEAAQHKLTDAHHVWQEIIHRERSERVETYRQLTLGKTSLWNDWRHGLPQSKRLALASMARLRATARATDSRPHRTAKISRFAITLFDALRRAHAAPAFGEQNMRRVMRAAARLHRVGGVRHAKPVRKSKSSPKAARRFLRELPMPPSWTYEEWDLLGWAVRFHRGPEPSPERGTFSTLSDEQQKNIQAIAGVLRLARAFRKCGLETCEGLRAEKTADAVILHVPGLPDSAESAARLAAAKHLLDTYIGKPLLLKPAPKRAPAPIQNPNNVVALLDDFQRHQESTPPKTLAAASGASSD